jgi:large subunit ribosomal protein L23
MNLSSFELIKEPIITEKSTVLSELSKYVFAIDKHATKTGVAKAIEEIFGVKVAKVNVVNIKGKVKRFRGRLGTRSDIRKAIVTLEKDNVIDFTGGVK